MITKMKVVGLLAFSALASVGVGSAGAAVLFQDDFSDGNFSSNPIWTPTAGTWSVGGGAVMNDGTTSNDYLRTMDFAPVTDGVFSVSVDVRFTSSTVTGNNRLYLRMRDSTAGYAGYEVAIAQGTTANTTFTAISGATLGTQWKTTSPQTFPLDSYVNITWTRDSSGAMTVYVDGKEYMSISSSSVSRFDTFEIGGRAKITDGPTYTYSFDNITISTVPEPASAASLVGGTGLALCFLRRRR